ncbi:radial spoke head 14 homolog isoform X1 [Lepisosteus oculatus]|uniref:Radial spoke head 14 homolog n=1 Tax=Lepisosteus oculatus TaxID=7918 RepID=W5M4I7_LEPOC|nr:PREDICTED: radial spoke head 14 homolog isoform X2 [Lepisosteus oculatus]
MATARISARLPPNIDPTRAPVAFGHRAVPKLVSALRDSDLLTRQRALMALCDLVHDPETAYQAIETGCLESLKALLKDEDSTVRLKTTEVLYLLATHNVGREALLRGDVLSPLSDLLEEPVAACRRNTHMALEMLAEFPAVLASPRQRFWPWGRTWEVLKQEVCRSTGALSVVDAGLVPRLVLKLQEECEEVQELILDTLTACLRVDALAALASDAVLALRDCLAHPSVGIRQRAARAMIGLSVPLEGKVRVCEEGVIPVLVGLLSDSHPDVSASAAGSLMNAAITTQGKYLALQAGAITSLLALVSSPRTDVCANALRALTALAEAPPARQELLGHVELLETRRHDTNEIISRAAATAIRVITWTP